MLSPNRIGTIHLISQPTQSWERKGQFPVNEAPEHIVHGGRNYIVYSASQCASQWYALGQLALRGTNPLDSKSWIKSGPIMTSANGNYGPGHNGFAVPGEYVYMGLRVRRFFKSPDGKEDWIVYHATSNPKGNCERKRYTMAGKVNWTDAGPRFARPPSLNTRLMGPGGEL
jgi:GH43 family beta-xylosidase